MNKETKKDLKKAIKIFFIGLIYPLIRITQVIWDDGFWKLIDK